MLMNFRASVAVLLALLVAGPALAAGLRADWPTTTLRHRAASRLKAPGRAAPAQAAALPAFYPGPLPGALLPDAAPQRPAPALVLLAGIVRLPNGQPCPGVCIFPTTDARQLAVTDADGIFYLPIPAHTALHIQADYFGVGSSQVAISGVAPQPVSIVLGQ